MGLRASDIHTEAGEKKAKIRFRIDGLLHDIFDDIPLATYHTFVSRIKLLSEMKLNVRDAAQDGRFTIGLGDKDIEMRVSVIPAEFGETIVMRILDPSATMVGLPDLGLRADNLALVKKKIAQPNGLILNTGPTGSGKTTTLYAFLRTMNDPTMKIITLEDPIEYRIDGIEQTQVDEESGYTFGTVLRAIVRQDPDVILVGEVRDLETADIALAGGADRALGAFDAAHERRRRRGAAPDQSWREGGEHRPGALARDRATPRARALQGLQKEAADGCGDRGEDQKISCKLAGEGG